MLISHTVQKDTFQLKPFSSMRLHFNTRSDLFHFPLHISIIAGADPLEAVPSFIVTTLLSKPSGALFQSHHSESKQARKCYLKPDRNLPLSRLRAWNVFCYTVVNPLTD